MKKRVMAGLLVMILLCVTMIQPANASYQENPEELRGACINEFVNTYEQLYLNRALYSTGVWQEIEGAYESLTRLLEEANTEEEILEASTQAGDQMDGLSCLKKSLIVEDMSVSEGKKVLLGKLKQIYGLLELKENTMTSQDEIKSVYQEGMDEIKVAQNFSDLGYAFSVTCDVLMNAGESQSDLEGAQQDGISLLQCYVKEYFSRASYSDAKWKQIQAILDDIIAQIKKTDTVYEVSMVLILETPRFNAYNSYTYDQYEMDLEMARMECFFGLASRMDGLEQGDYSATDLAQIMQMINDAMETLEKECSIAKIKSVYADIIKKLDSTPTQYQQLSKAKQNAKAKLNRYRNNPKYNQKKVVPIVQKGIKKIEACESTAAVKKVLRAYVKKANGTVRKFRIKISSNRGGTVTKSKTVVYGKTMTIKVKPYAGYQIKKVLIDGKKVPIKKSYKLKQITKKHSVKVVFHYSIAGEN